MPMRVFCCTLWYNGSKVKYLPTRSHAHSYDSCPIDLCISAAVLYRLSDEDLTLGAGRFILKQNELSAQVLMK